METLNTLGVALGLACLAGLNLYLTVFATGLAIHYHWITLSPHYQSLEVLGNPVVIIVAGVLFCIEFLADKVPWVDSAWDVVHTVIRPIGGALLAIQVLGHPNPVFAVVVGLLGGGTSLIAHTAKSATRLASNTSPEPFSNIALSLGEDAAVVGGLALIHYNPILALSIFVLAIATFLYFAPKIVRATKVKIWLIAQKLNLPAHLNAPEDLPRSLPAGLGPTFDQQNVLAETIVWAVPCISGRGRRIRPNVFGALVATKEEPRKIVFVGPKGRHPTAQTIDLDGMTVLHDSKFLSENLLILPQSGKSPRYLFLFPRSRAGMVEQIVAGLQKRLAEPPARAAMAPPFHEVSAGPG